MSIFDGTEPPRWLEQIAKPIDTKETGQTLGMMLGAGLLALQSDPTAKPNDDGTRPVKGFQRGLYEARMNSSDPNWLVKTEQLKAQAAGSWAKSATEWQQYNMTARDASLWATKDLPALTKYQEELKTNPNATPPVMESSQGQQAAQKIETFQLRKTQQQQAMQMQKLRIDNSSVNLKRRAEWEDAYAALTPTEALDVDALQDGGRDQQGNLTPEARQKINEIRGRQGKPAVGTPATVQTEMLREQNATTKETTHVKEINQLTEWQKQAKEAEAKGDTNTAKELRSKATLLEEQMKGFGVSVSYDDQGRAIINMGKGSQPTVATQTMAQGKLLQYENATQLMNWLSDNLTEAHVGVSGAAGEFLVDKSLEQLLPGVANKERIKARTTLIGLRETLLREMSDDRTGRFSVADRNEIEKALPSSGIFESKEDALERINRVREILADRGKVYARAMGVRPPLWTLSKEETIQMYQDGQKSGLDPNSPEFKKQFLTKDEATDALVRFH